MAAVFTYLPGDRPDGYDPAVGFGFAGNFGYWYVDFIAEPSTFTDHWLTAISGGVRLNIGERARYSDETDRTDHYIDFDGATLTANGRIAGTVAEVTMGVAAGQYAGDYFRIDNPVFSTAELNDAIAAFQAAPDDNMGLADALTHGVQVIRGQTALDNHGGFADERRLRNVDLGDGDDIFYWQGGNRKTATIDLGDGRDLLRLYTTDDARVDLASHTATIGTAQARVFGVETLFLGSGTNVAAGSSASEFIVGGIGEDRVQGRGGNDRLVGDRGNDRLSGGAGRDRLDSGDGKDTLLGGAGRDRLIGGAGKDTLDGGTGNDLLIGGGGRDTFVFGAGHDSIRKFNGDLLNLDDALWAGTLSRAQVLDFANVVAGDTVFDFGDANTLTLRNFTDIEGLQSVLTIF